MNNLAGRLGHFIANNSPVILTAVGASGLIAATVSAARAGYQSRVLIEDRKKEIREENGMYSDEEVFLTKREVLYLVGPAYTPSVLIVGTTLAAILGAHTINKRRQALLIGAYSLIDNAYKEYRETVREGITPKKYQEIDDTIAERRIEKDNLTRQDLMIIGGEKQPCYEVWSKRYFPSDMEAIRKAMNDVNLKVSQEGYAPHSDFYEALGIDAGGYADKVGWTAAHPMDISFTAVLQEGKPVLAIQYYRDPSPDFLRVW